MGWTASRTRSTSRYFDAFYKATYDDAARVAAGLHVLTTPPLRQWRWQQDKEKKGEAAGWSRPDFDDAAWKTTDVRGRHLVGAGAAQLHGLGVVPHDGEAAGRARRARRCTSGSARPTAR